MALQHGWLSGLFILLSLVLIPVSVVTEMYLLTGVCAMILLDELLPYEWDEHPERYDLSDSDQFVIRALLNVTIWILIAVHFLQ